MIAVTTVTTGDEPDGQGSPTWPGHVALARDLARERLRGLDARVVGDCLLVVSELVTNAIRHGGGVTLFEIVARAGRVVVSVGDRSGDVPVATAAPGGLLPGGHGWPLVCRLAEKITISPLADGGKAIQVSLAY
ncbi:ATP-binding protein [Streptomyces sp. NPDC050560]|uniref:ATP-binding protein n=1 Tax=Streptomyces sp. NPDC050560 TaxID=3365630 RepID=UPI0037993068